MEVLNIINIFNRVYEQLGQKPLLDNPNFRVDQEMKSDHYLQIHSIEKEGRIEMMFEIVTDRLTFRLDRTNEIPEWSSNYIQNNKKEFEKELKQLFKNKMTIEYKGNRTKIRLVNKSGKEIRKFRYYQGLRINMFSKKTIKNFEPYF